MAVELDVGQPLLLVPGEGEVVGDVPDRRVEILCDRDELVVTWTRFGPHRDGASPHIHRTHTDLFFVLDGELTFSSGRRRRSASCRRGRSRSRRRSLVHGFRNAGDGELRYLNFHAPSGGFADYLRGRNPDFDQSDPPEDGGLPLTEAIIVPAGTGGVLIDRDEIRIEVRDEPGQASGGLTCLYALEDGRFLEIRA